MRVSIISRLILGAPIEVMSAMLLHYDEAPAAALLATDAGEPVWPISCPDDRRALESVAALFCLTLTRVRGVPCTLPESLETVVAFGPEAERPARLHAHLTRRQSQRADRIADIFDARDPAVVVTRPDRLTTQLFEALYDYSLRHGRVCGVLCAASEPRLIQQVLVRAAAAAASADALPDLHLFPTLPFARTSSAEWEMLGTKVGAAEIRKACTRPAGLLSITTHADGVDAYLGPDLVLCPFVDRPASPAPPGDEPRCEATGFCHRRQQARAAAMVSDALIAPSGLAARVLLLNTCLGVLPADGVVAPGWGFGIHFTESCRIGAVVMPWEVVFSRPVDTMRIAKMLRAGRPVGAVVADVNRESESAETLPRFCVFGDPRVQLPKSVSDGLPDFNDGPRATDTSRRVIARVSGLRGVLAAAAHQADADCREAAITALARAEAAELALLRGVPFDGGHESPGAQMRAAVLSYICRRGKMNDAWAPLTDRVTHVAGQTCALCGSIVRTRIVGLRPPGVASRRLVICPRCGVTTDVPEECVMALAPAVGASVRVALQPLPSNWCGRLLVSSSLAGERVEQPWPAGESGQPRSVCDVPAGLQEGPLRVSAIFVWDAEYAILSQMSRRSRLWE